MHEKTTTTSTERSRRKGNAPISKHGGEGPNAFLALQRLAGNATVSRLVDTARKSEPTPSSQNGESPRKTATNSPSTGKGNPVIRRFPATAMTGPTDWVSQTANVKRPGEGLSGGVYILSANDPQSPIKTVVVKPIFGASGLGTIESGASMTFGDRALSELMGINTPISRSVAKGSKEYQQLLTLCDPKSPPRPTDDQKAQDWVPLSSAKSFVVMSEVPNSATVGGLAEKSVSDPRAMQQLHTAIFDPGFLHQLGRLCIGDLLIGNDDRMVARAMNVGNLMISSQGDKHSLYAIDTNSVLGGDLNPTKVLASGSGSSSLQGGFSSTKNTIQEGPEEILDGFYRILASRMKDTQAKDGQPGALQLDPATVLSDSYQAQRDLCLLAFKGGWQSGLDTVRALVESKKGRTQMRGVTKGVQNDQGAEQVSYQALKTNAMYLAGRAKGKEHEESTKDPAAYAAIKMLAEFDLTKAMIPNDGISWNVARVPPKDVLGADLQNLANAPNPEHLRRIAPARQAGIFDPGYFTSMLQGADAIKAEVEALGAKERGVFSRKPQMRNRTMAGRFIAETYQLGAAAQRAAAASGHVDQLARTIEIAVGATPTPSQAQKALPAAEHLKHVLPQFKRDIGQFGDGLTDASKGVSSIKKLGLAPQLAQVLGQLATRMQNEESKLSDARTANPNIYVNALRGATK